MFIWFHHIVIGLVWGCIRDILFRSKIFLFIPIQDLPYLSHVGASYIYIYVKVEFNFSLTLLIGCGCSPLAGSSAALPHHFSTFYTTLPFLPLTCGCLAALPRYLAALSFLPLLSYCLPIGYLLGCWPTPNSRLCMDLL